MNENDEQPQTGTDAQAHVPAKHGYRNEVNWEGGSGRQPYSNQAPQQGASPAAAQEVPEGNRAERSGTNLDQLERVKIKP